jgi:hypothetical protein
VRDGEADKPADERHDRTTRGHMEVCVRGSRRLA